MIEFTKAKANSFIVHVVVWCRAEQCWSKFPLDHDNERLGRNYAKLNIYCCLLKLSSKPKLWLLHVVVLQRTALDCSKVRAARAARLFFLVPQIKLFNRDVDVEVIPMNIGCFSHQVIVMSLLALASLSHNRSSSSLVKGYLLEARDLPSYRLQICRPWKTMSQFDQRIMCFCPRNVDQWKHTSKKLTWARLICFFQIQKIGGNFLSLWYIFFEGRHFFTNRYVCNRIKCFLLSQTELLYLYHADKTSTIKAVQPNASAKKLAALICLWSLPELFISNYSRHRVLSCRW